MVIQELVLWFGAMDRKRMPSTGAIIVSERTGLPWHSQEFRRYWRKIATHAGIPPEVKNMDTRSGAITEATDAGIPLETIRHASTHSDVGMVQRYSRGSTEKIADVMQLRQASRKT
jgi:site-specific recombinase XerD